MIVPLIYPKGLATARLDKTTFFIELYSLTVRDEGLLMKAMIFVFHFVHMTS
jgi:hypothetical protein